MDADRSWTTLESHRGLLRRDFAGILRFSLRSIRAEGGFEYLDRDGRPFAGKVPALFLTARMTYTASVGFRLGIPGSGALLDHGMRSLRGIFADTEHGGWLSTPEGAGARKSVYDQVQVALAAAGATAAAHPLAGALRDAVVELVDHRLWDEATHTVFDSFAADWSDPEAYRGANANMHAVEAFLALGRVTGDADWHAKARQIADRIVNHAAREQDWFLPEHYDQDWAPLPEYNRDEPAHPFRPYGVTPGHLVEWARLLVELHQSTLLDRAGWELECARALTHLALDELWAADGRPGLVYTVDRHGRPVCTTRLHWPVCEAIQTTAALHRVTGDAHWERWYRTLWDHAAMYFIDDRGSWINELDESMHEGGTMWPGRPDVYHCGGALTGPIGATV